MFLTISPEWELKRRKVRRMSDFERFKPEDEEP